MMNFLKECL